LIYILQPILLNLINSLMSEIWKIFTHFDLNGKVIWDGKSWSKHFYKGFLGSLFRMPPSEFNFIHKEIKYGVYNLKLRQKIGSFFSCKRTSKVKMPLNHTQSSFIGAQMS